MSAPVSERRLKMRAYEIQVAVVRPAWEVAMVGGPSTTYETRTIYGYTRLDAMHRAGIK